MTSALPRRGLPAPVLLLTILLFASGASADEWTTYAHPNDLTDIIADGGFLWMSSTGGALRFELATGEFRQFPRRISGGPASQDLVGVCRDDSGLLYFGSANRGITTFDPESDRWRRFEEIPSNVIRGVSCLAGDVYIATASGFAIRRAGTEICNDIDRGCCGDNPSSCAFPSFDVRDFGLRGSDIWAATAAGPAEFSGGRWRARGGASVLDSRTIEGVGEDVFTATSAPGGVFRWNPASSQWDPAAGGLRVNQGLGDRVRLVNSEGRLFLCCSYGLFEWTGSAWTGTGLEDVDVRSAVALPVLGNNLFAATSNGLWARRDAGPTTSWTRFAAAGPPSRVPGQAVTADGNGTIWVGTFGGVMRLSTDGTWTSFPNGQNGLAPSDIFSVFADSRNRAWVGKCCCPTPAECPTQWIDGATISAALPSLNGWTMTEDGAGRLWVGSNSNGVYALGPDGAELANLTVTSTGGTLRSNSVRTIAAAGNRVWIGHENNGLQIVNTNGTPANPGAFTWTLARQLPEPSVVDLALEGTEAWVLTSANLSRYRDDIKFEQHPLSTGGVPRSGRAVAVDGKGNKWVATGSGALRLNRGGTGFTVFTTGNSDLIDDDIYDVAVDPKTGDILFQTRIGTSRLRPGASNPGGSVDGLYLYPNPFRYDGAGVVKVGGGPADNAVVTDLAGRPVASFAAAEGWNGRGSDGAPVAPGLYLVVVDGERVLKVAVLR